MKINYKGGNRKIDYDYRCTDCKQVFTIEHSMRESTEGRLCTMCNGEARRYISKPPALDADYRESQLTRNKGWEQ